MPTPKDLRNLTSKRRQTVVALMDAKEWAVAAYMMGHTLEYALKAVVCRTLKLDMYPPLDKNSQEVGIFKTHDFERLLIISGLRDIFTINGRYGPGPYQNWSDFTLEYAPDWTVMRYDDALHRKFNERKVRGLYINLYDDNESILKTISRRKKW